VLSDLVGRCGHEFAGYIDDLGPSSAEVLGTFEQVRPRYAAAAYGIVIGVGYRDLPARWRVFERVASAGYAMPALVHPEAYLHSADCVGAGSVVMARAIVDARAAVGRACVLWPGANVSHDSTVGDNSFLSPNSTVCGFVTVGRDCFLGAGAVVADHRTVPAGTTIKAGEVWSG
jgi:acetyltransferase-like isoleucine patch superfamily enzyme